jgi:hypothetical protein
MVSATHVALIVFKRTGGRAWLKPWGFTGFNQTQKATRRKQNARFARNRDALRQAEDAHWQHLEATSTLPHWGESHERVRQRKLDSRRKNLLWKAARDRYLPRINALFDAIQQESSRQGTQEESSP